VIAVSRNSALRGIAVFGIFAFVGPVIGGMTFWLFGLAIQPSNTWERFQEQPTEILTPIIFPLSFIVGGVPAVLTGMFFGALATMVGWFSKVEAACVAFIFSGFVGPLWYISGLKSDWSMGAAIKLFLAALVFLGPFSAAVAFVCQALSSRLHLIRCPNSNKEPNEAAS